MKSVKFLILCIIYLFACKSFGFQCTHKSCNDDRLFLSPHFVNLHSSKIAINGVGGGLGGDALWYDREFYAHTNVGINFMDFNTHSSHNILSTNRGFGTIFSAFGDIGFNLGSLSKPLFLGFGIPMEMYNLNSSNSPNGLSIGIIGFGLNLSQRYIELLSDMMFEYALGIYYGLGVYNFAALEPKGLFRNGLNTQGFITQGFVGLIYGERYNLFGRLKVKYHRLQDSKTLIADNGLSVFYPASQNFTLVLELGMGF